MRVVADDAAVADDADAAVALRSTPASTRQPAIVPTRLIVKRSLHQRPAELDFALFRLEHAFQGRLQVVGDLVDDVVAADLHALLLGQRAGLFVGHDVEADDDRVRGVGQVHVGLGDAADAWPAAP